jgi:hypothetical protein
MDGELIITFYLAGSRPSPQQSASRSVSSTRQSEVVRGPNTSRSQTRSTSSRKAYNRQYELDVADRSAKNGRVIEYYIVEVDFAVFRILLLVNVLITVSILF